MAERPNVLFLQCDQMTAFALPAYGNRLVSSPHLDALAGDGVVFENAYCNFPICAPSRFSMLAGRLASRIGAFDNAAELPASTPTFVHHLRAAGYHTCLSGKMHFAGPDQLHGFEERLTTDIYPADFYWTPSWDRDAPRPSYDDGGGVSGVNSLDIGVCERSQQIDYDEEVAHRAVRKLYDLGRERDARPFLLAVSFTHPHDPYVARAEHWARYRAEDVAPPAVASIPYEDKDPHSRRHHVHIGLDRAGVPEEKVRRLRHGYLACVSYVDDLVGRVLAALDAAGLRERTLIAFTSDHGDMLGERGMWFKQTFYEWAMRVPLLLHWPGRLGPRRVAQNVSLVDVFPTLLEAAGIDPGEAIDRLDGASLLPLAAGDATGWPNVVCAEHLSDAAYAPRFMLRHGYYKYVCSPAYPPMLFDLERDPHELHDLAGVPAHAAAERDLAAHAERRWDAAALDAEIRLSQRRRRFVQEALVQGRYTPWDYAPPVDAAHEYVRLGHSFPASDRARYLPWPLREE